jgi:hypothetical protein
LIILPKSKQFAKNNQNNFWWIGQKLELCTYNVLINGKANNDTKLVLWQLHPLIY